MQEVKPPLVRPTMADVAARRGRNGLSVVSTFSGCGGSCLGLELAGFDVRVASEFIPEARATYEANHPGVPVLADDVRNVKGSDLLAAAGLDSVDVLEGSPPCSPFSTAGSREGGWGQAKKYSDTVQRTDDLFFEFSRLLGELRPRAFIAENVPGLTIGAAVGYYNEVIASLQGRGYRVRAAILDAARLGVPQRRRRLIIVGLREDEQGAFAWPKPLPYTYTIRDAVATVAGVTVRYRPGGAEARDRRLSVDEPAPTVSATGFGTGFAGQARVEDPDPPVLDGYAIGREARTLNAGEQSDRYFNLVRPALDEPCPTLTQTAGQSGAAGVIHPDGTRKFTIAELRALCGFPADFVLTGTYAQQWERLGRAVPPPLMAAVGRQVAQALGKETPL